MQPKFIFLILGIVLLGVLLVVYPMIAKPPSPKLSSFSQPSPTPPFVNSVKATDAYTIILVGDSMTQLLGENTTEFREALKEHYPNKVFGIFNYGFGSTNILSAPDRLEKDTTFDGKNYQAILNREFDLIIIESFGHNPLSEYPLDQGLKLQTQTLDKMITEIHQKHPKSVIAFMATISPNKNRYAEGAVVLMPDKRQEWSAERIAYIKNHIQYAKDHHILLINVYEKSLTKDGDGNIDFINTSDFIHPSPTGVNLISKTMADFIYDNQILPP